MRQILALAILIFGFGGSFAEGQALNPSSSERSFLLNEYVAQIHRAIRRNWIFPSDLPRDAKCRIRIRQSQSGVVEDLRILECQSKVLEDSVVKAISRASPLPKPKDPALFQSEIILEFREQ